MGHRLENIYLVQFKFTAVGSKNLQMPVNFFPPLLSHLVIQEKKAFSRCLAFNCKWMLQCYFFPLVLFYQSIQFFSMLYLVTEKKLWPNFEEVGDNEILGSLPTTPPPPKISNNQAQQLQYFYFLHSALNFIDQDTKIDIYLRKRCDVLML